jgi:hypothetical protein
MTMFPGVPRGAMSQKSVHVRSLHQVSAGYGRGSRLLSTAITMLRIDKQLVVYMVVFSVSM